jgi:predicted nucleotide-binding protein (sugar kinase/HSP70/actin superfamily)
MEAAAEDFKAIPTEARGTKPLVGIVGEIYIRSNVFANEDLIRTIERLGGEAWLPPIGEWLFYINYISARRARRYRDYGQALKLWLTQRSQFKIEHALAAPFEGFVVNLHEPSIGDTIDFAEGFLDISFEGEAILSVGKSRDFLQKGASGIINAMPFTCMPGTIVNALMKRFREQNGNVPFLNMAYDGQEESGSLARLQAFMYQVRDYQARHNPAPRKPRTGH